MSTDHGTESPSHSNTDQLSTPPSTDILESTVTRTYTGRCKWFNNRLGYGFITVDNPNKDVPEDIFIHQTNIQPSSSTFRTLRQGEYVSFVVRQDENNTVQAINVTGLNGGPLLCDTYVEQRKFVNERGRGRGRGHGRGRGRGRGRGHGRDQTYKLTDHHHYHNNNSHNHRNDGENYHHHRPEGEWIWKPYSLDKNDSSQNELIPEPDA